MGQAPRFVVDPAHPQAPSLEVWAELSEAERQQVVDSLPSEFVIEGAPPPEGDLHFETKVRVRDVLRRFFGRGGRGAFVGNELAVYYPGEPVIAPDVMVVTDVDPHPRERWVVAAEGKGADLVIEIHVAGDRARDVRHKLKLYGRLGVREYFIFEPRRGRVVGQRLSTTGARDTYVPIVPQGGLYASEVLGLEIAVEAERLRFYHDLAPLPEAAELLARLHSAVDELVEKREAAERRAEEEARAAEQEAHRAEEEKRRADDNERKLREALAELERLRGR